MSEAYRIALRFWAEENGKSAFRETRHISSVTSGTMHRFVYQRRKGERVMGTNLCMYG